jgi:uncharacterized protein involved in oxidation of intracellular sulfur
MKLGFVIYSNDAETVWNAFRLGVFALKKGDTVNAFLLGKGVECETVDTEKFTVTDQMKTFVAAGGKILACGTCLKIRQSEGYVPALDDGQPVRDCAGFRQDTDVLKTRPGSFRGTVSCPEPCSSKDYLATDRCQWRRDWPK